MSNITVNVIAPGQITTWGEAAWDVGTWGVGQGLNATTGSPTIDAEISVGWGGDQWNVNAWGDLATTYAPVTTAGLLQTSIGEEEYAGTTTGWGRPSWNTGGWGIFGDVFTHSFLMSTSVGVVTIDAELNVGWGRDHWGNGGWGVQYSAAPSGQVLTSSVGNSTATTDVTVGVTGQQLNFAAVGTFSIQIDSSVTIVQAGEKTMNLSLGTQSLVQTTVESVTGQSLTSSVGSVVAGLFLGVPVTGSTATTSIGNQSLVQSTVETVSGQSMTSSIGSIGAIPQQQVGVTGQSLTLSLGEESTVGNAKVLPTGIALTSSIGSTNITSWNEVQVGVSNTWTEVDIAA